MPEKLKLAVIGAGISGLAAAIELADKGCKVAVFEKNPSYGGRGQMIERNGFKFDLGPSWYWMPDVFERFFQDYGKSTSDYYELLRLDPSYQIIFSNETIQIPAEIHETYALFEQIEPGSSVFLEKFLKEAKYKYEVGMQEFVRKPALQISEFLSIRLLKSVFSMELFSSLEAAVFKGVKNDKLRKLLCFPVLFLGAKPSETPALYSLMNYADLILGSWYPKGGMIKLFEALYLIAIEKGVQFHFNTAVEKINIENKTVNGIRIAGKDLYFDAVLSTADYHHTDTALVDSKYRQYSNSYWEDRTMAPSALIFYLGINKRIDHLLHHNLFFNSGFEKHTAEIYDTKVWPEEPLFYACVPSKTDLGVAPPGNENLFLLVPIASGIKDSLDQQDRIFEYLLDQLETHTGQEIRSSICFKESMCVHDFEQAYNSFKGNAYGLANTLKQTSILKPRIRHNKVKGLYFAGQLTHPGPGLPPSLISGQISAKQILKDYKYEF
ncbi:MAG: phytoene desaturase [Saprospiraceae bacterium]|nr:phytoene desaturase [Saprospiraceae bacterium]